MAHIRSHLDAHTAPRWAAGGLRRARRAARFLAALEATAERHWPMAAYTVLSVATAGYVVAQLARL